MHALRLLQQCKELLAEATITPPRPGRDFFLLIRVPAGKYSMDEDEVVCDGAEAFGRMRGGGQIVVACRAGGSGRCVATPDGL
jgi:hypothetical protein